MTLFSRIANFRCSDCAMGQPAFALLTTTRGSAATVRMNDFALCPDCGARLRLGKSRGSGQYFLGGLLSVCTWPVLFAICALGFFIGRYIVGDWGALIGLLLSFGPGFYVLSARRARVFGWFVKVQKL